MSKIVSIVHIYRFAELAFVVPLVQITRGPWQETLPVHQVNRQNVAELTLALEKTQRIKNLNVGSAPNAWKTEWGEILRESSALCTIRWYEDGKVRIVPQHLLVDKNNRDDETEQGWYDISTEAIEFTISTPLSEIAQLVFERL